MRFMIGLLIAVSAFGQFPSTPSQWKRTGPNTIAPSRAGDSVVVGNTVLAGPRQLNGSGNAAICVAGLTPALAFGTPAGTGTIAVCDADGLQGYAKFPAGATNTINLRVKLPAVLSTYGMTWTGTLKLWLDAFSVSTTAVAISTYLACGHAATTGPTFGGAQTLSFTPGATSALTSAVQSLTATGCAAGDIAYLKISIPATAGAGNDFYLLTAQVTE